MNYQGAIEDFRRARRRAAIQDVLSRLWGRSNELLAYNDVRRKLKATNVRERGLQEIPLDAIVGSVNRYRDFTRDFLPKLDTDEHRWARVKSAFTDIQKGVPPIDVYKIGDAYFVSDGNHRVSVARQLGAPTISAYVTEVSTRVPLSTKDDVDKVICKARYADFLERTNLDKIRPEANLLMTLCGHYHVLEEHIEVHRYFMGKDWQREISYEEAVGHWYDEVYLPVVELIRQQGLLYEFPERTETDLYVLLAEYRAELEEVLGWEVSPESLAPQLAGEKGTRSTRMVARVSERLRNVVTPSELVTGPPPGVWREERLSARRDDRLFADILVAARGTEEDLPVLEQAIKVATWEHARLLGYHVYQPDGNDEETIAQARDVLMWRCGEEGLTCEAASEEAADTARAIVGRAVWADLVVLNLRHPPGTQILDRLGSGFSKIIHRCPRPILAVPTGAQSDMDRAMLAYNGSAKSREALFVAVYLAQRWQVELAVVTVKKDAVTAAAQDEARAYLDQHGVTAEFIEKRRPSPGQSAQVLLETAAAWECNLLLMGGYRSGPMMQVVLGSTLDEILRSFHRPMLICR